MNERSGSLNTRGSVRVGASAGLSEEHLSPFHGLEAVPGTSPMTNPFDISLC